MIADQSTVVERLFLCGQCEHKRGNGFTAYCGECKCPIETATRTAWKACPVGKWAATEESPKIVQSTKQFAKCCGSK